MSTGIPTIPPAASSERALVCTFAPDGVVTEANPAAFELAGVTPESVLGRRFDVVPPLCHSAEIIERIDDILKRASQGACTIAEHARSSMEEVSGLRRRVTISAGVTALNEDAATPSEMLRRCDIELYRAKREGRNRVAST